MLWNRSTNCWEGVPAGSWRQAGSPERGRGWPLSGVWKGPRAGGCMAGGPHDGETCKEGDLPFIIRTSLLSYKWDLDAINYDLEPQSSVCAGSRWGRSHSGPRRRWLVAVVTEAAMGPGRSRHTWSLSEGHTDEAQSRDLNKIPGDFSGRRLSPHPSPGLISILL